MPPIGPHGLHTTRNPTCSWARMQARKPSRPTGRVGEVGPEGLLLRGAQCSARVGAYKLVLALLN